MSAPVWWARAALLAALSWPAAAAAQAPPSAPVPAASAPAPAEPTVVATIPAGTCVTLASPIQVVGPAGASDAQQRRHPVWNATRAVARFDVAVIHGPAVPMPVTCSSLRAEATFFFGSCRAFYGEYRSPFYKPGRDGCGCGDR